MATVFRCAQAGLYQTPIDHNVIHTLNRPQCIIIRTVCYIRGRWWSLDTRIRCARIYHNFMGFPIFAEILVFLKNLQKKKRNDTEKKSNKTWSDTPKHALKSRWIGWSHSLQHLPVLVVDQRQTPNSFEPLWHSPNACDSPRFSAFAADLVGVSPLSRPKSVTKKKHQNSLDSKLIRAIRIPKILPALAIAA